MILQPLKDVPIKTPTASLFAISLFPVYQTREDYERATGKPCPPPDPSRRAKYWYDPRYEDITPDTDDWDPILYTVPAYNSVSGAPLADSKGRARLTQLPMYKWEAGSVNIPYGTTNEFKLGSVINSFIPVPFPIRDLHPDEELVVDGFVIGVRNKVLWAQQRQAEAQRNIVVLADSEWKKMEELIRRILGKE